MRRLQHPSVELSQTISAILQKHQAEIQALGLNLVDFQGVSCKVFVKNQNALTDIRSRLPRITFPEETKRIYREVPLFEPHAEDNK